MILIVDDDLELAENCSMMLEAHGYTVGVALSGNEAIFRITEEVPELLISDCCMEDMSGPQLSQKLRTAGGDFNFPILLMSGSLQCRAALGASYDAFIKKPFLAEGLLHEVKKLLAIPRLDRVHNIKRNN